MMEILLIEVFSVYDSTMSLVGYRMLEEQGELYSIFWDFNIYTSNVHCHNVMSQFFLLSHPFKNRNGHGERNTFHYTTYITYIPCPEYSLQTTESTMACEKKLMIYFTWPRYKICTP